MNKQITYIEIFLNDWPTDETLLGSILNNIKHYQYSEGDVSFLFCDTKDKCLFWKDNIDLFLHLYVFCMLHQWNSFFESKIIDTRYSLFSKNYRKEILKECLDFYRMKDRILPNLYHEIELVIGIVYNVPVKMNDKLKYLYRTILLENETTKHIINNFKDNRPWVLSGCFKAVVDYVSYQCSCIYVSTFQYACDEIKNSISDDTGNKEYPFYTRLYQKLFNIIHDDLNREIINGIIRTYQNKCLLDIIEEKITILKFDDWSNEELTELAHRTLYKMCDAYTSTEFFKNDLEFDDNIKTGISIYSKVATYYYVKKKLFQDSFNPFISDYEKKELEKCVNKYVHDGIVKYIELLMDGSTVPKEASSTNMEESDYSDWYHPGYSG